MDEGYNARPAHLLSAREDSNSKNPPAEISARRIETELLSIECGADGVSEHTVRAGRQGGRHRERRREKSASDGDAIVFVEFRWRCEALHRSAEWFRAGCPRDFDWYSVQPGNREREAFTRVDRKWRETHPHRVSRRSNIPRS